MTKRKTATEILKADPPPAPLPTPAPPVPTESFWSRLRSAPWVIVILIAALAATFLPIWPDGTGGYTTMEGYVVGWFGGQFKAMTGGVVGFLFCRKVLKINLSEIPDLQSRSIAGLGCAVVIAAFVVAVAGAT